MKNILIINTILLLLFSSVLFAGNREFTKYLKNNTYIATETTEIIEFKGDIYLVSVGKSKIEDISSPQSRIDAIEEATLQAQKGIMQFVHGTQTSSLEQLTKKSVTTKIIEDGKVLSIDKKKTKKFLRVIKEEGKGAIKKLKR
jgi:hypothetical protein